MSRFERIAGTLSIVGLVAGLLYFALDSREDVQPPRIVTVWDTVERLDTLWRTAVRERAAQQETVQVNLIESVLVSIPETVYVDTTFNLSGIEAVLAGEIGEDTRVEGFTLTGLAQDGTVLARENWRTTVWTPGPLRSVLLRDTLPPLLSWYDPPATCNFLCRLKIGAIGGLVALPVGIVGGYALCQVVN